MNIGCVQTEPKLLRNGWTDESTSNSADGGRRPHVGGGGGGPSAPGINTAEPPRSTSLKVAGVTVTVPGWLAAWWQEFTSDKAVMVEVISRALFPLMFFIFNIIYWPWYLM